MVQISSDAASGGEQYTRVTRALKVWGGVGGDGRGNVVRMKISNSPD